MKQFIIFDEWILMIDAQDIAEKIRHRRNEMGLTQSALAQRAGVSLPTITRIEQGRCFEVGFGTMIRILNEVSYDLSIDFGVTPNPTQSTPDLRKQQVLDKYYFGKKA